MEERKTVEADYLLKSEDIVSFTPRNVEAAVHTPSIRKTKKYLIKQGFMQEAGTGGDHQNWRSPQGAPLKFNPDNHDNKVLDWPSFEDYAKLLDTSTHDLYIAIMSPKQASQKV